MGSGVHVGTVLYRKISCLYRESNVSRPSRSPSLHQICYPIPEVRKTNLLTDLVKVLGSVANVRFPYLLFTFVAQLRKKGPSRHHSSLHNILRTLIRFRIILIGLIMSKANLVYFHAALPSAPGQTHPDFLANVFENPNFLFNA